MMAFSKFVRLRLQQVHHLRLHVHLQEACQDLLLLLLLLQLQQVHRLQLHLHLSGSTGSETAKNVTSQK